MIKKIFFLIFLQLLNASYSEDLGKNLCKLSVASYCNTNKLASWTCKPCLSSPIKLDTVRIFYNSTGDSQGMIGVSK